MRHSVGLLQLDAKLEPWSVLALKPLSEFSEFC